MSMYIQTYDLYFASRSLDGADCLKTESDRKSCLNYASKYADYWWAGDVGKYDVRRCASYDFNFNEDYC